MTLIVGGRFATPDGVLPGWLETSGPHIVAVSTGSPPRSPDRDLAGTLVVPGFVDLHVHGGAGADYSSAEPDAAAHAALAHRRRGTTTTMASLVTADLTELTDAVAALAELVDDGLLAGIHLEGPFLSAARCGAHDPALLRHPERHDVDRLLRAGRGTVRMLTLAPELPGGLHAVQRLAAEDVVVAVGHTDATYEQTHDAIAAGATVATHLFNGMPPMHHRDPGPAGALLEDERISVELICDGVHLHPSTVRLAAKAAGRNRVALVTDAMAAAGASDGRYELGGRAVRVRHGVARLVDGGALAASTLTMDQAFRFAVQNGVTIDDAVRMSSTTPAAVLGLSHRTGSIAPGFDADLVVLNEALAVTAVMAKGHWVS